MSKKRSFHQIEGWNMFPACKRRKMCRPDVEHKEPETISDNESIASVVESIDSLESDTEHQNAEDYDEQYCISMLRQLQFNTYCIIPCYHLTQTMCVLGGNSPLLQSMLAQITNELSDAINDYNLRLHVVDRTDSSTIKPHSKSIKLLHTMLASKLLENKSFDKVSCQRNIDTQTMRSHYEGCDICMVFPDTNITVLCQMIAFMTSSRGIHHRFDELKVIKAYRKRIVVVNIGGFFNGLRLQIMNFTANDLPNPANIVFVDALDAAIQQLKVWSM